MIQVRQWIRAHHDAFGVGLHSTSLHLKSVGRNIINITGNWWCGITSNSLWTDSNIKTTFYMLSRWIGWKSSRRNNTWRYADVKQSSAEELLKQIRVDSLLSDTNGEEVQLQKFLFDCPIDKTKGIYDGRDDYIKCKRYEKKMKQRTDWRTRRMMGRVWDMWIESNHRITYLCQMKNNDF